MFDGKMLLEEFRTDSIDISNLSQGLYVVKAWSNNQEEFVFKIQK